ncbi:MAG: hypothetical protein LBU33_00360 [Endomicrobium sp.]|nr:hypothetical protein [Endomicrobium sp.]
MKRLVSLVICCMVFIGCDQLSDSIASKVTVKMIEPIAAAMKGISADTLKAVYAQQEQNAKKDKTEEIKK